MSTRCGRIGISWTSRRKGVRTFLHRHKSSGRNSRKRITVTRTDPHETTGKEETMKAWRIKGAFALVTVANRVIGRALTEALLSRGVKKVYATASNPEALRDLRDERLVSQPLDVTHAGQAGAAEEPALDGDLCFNHAGAVLGHGIA